MKRHTAWIDVQRKAKRLLDQGHVMVESYSPYSIYGEVDGDHGRYEVEVHRTNAFGKGISWHSCRCLWNWHSYNTMTYPRYVARPCSHVMAMLYKAQSLDFEYKRKRKSGGMGFKFYPIIDSDSCKWHARRDETSPMPLCKDSVELDIMAPPRIINGMNAPEEICKVCLSSVNKNEAEDLWSPSKTPKRGTTVMTNGGHPTRKLGGALDKDTLIDFVEWIADQGYDLEDVPKNIVVQLAMTYAEENELNTEELTTLVFGEFFYDPDEDPTRTNERDKEVAKDVEDVDDMLTIDDAQMGSEVETVGGRGEVVGKYNKNGVRLVRVAGIDYSGRPFDDWYLPETLEMVNTKKNARLASARTSGKNYTLDEQQDLIDEEGTAMQRDSLLLDGTHYETHMWAI